MKYKILLLISVFLLSGCTAEYNTYITKETVAENTIVNGLTKETFPVTAYINDQGASETNEKIEGIEYYTINQNIRFTEYKFNFPFENYKNGTGVNYCYKNFHIYTTNENDYRLSTNNLNSCMDYYTELTEIKVNLKFSDDFNITSNNADEVNDQTYTWLINRDNYNNKTIEIAYSLIKTNPVVSDEETNNNINVFIILGSFVVLGVVLTIVIKKRNKY